MELRLYEVIYQVLEDVNSALVGMLQPEFEEVVTGDAEVREVFGVPRVGKVAGCYVLNGVITRGSKVRFLREGVVIWNGAITSLKRFKDDVREVQSGFECGIGLSDFQDLKPGDVIETYDLREIPRELSHSSSRSRCSPLGLVGEGERGRQRGELAELVDPDELEAVGPVGVADEEIRAVRGELRVVVGAAPGAHEREVGLVVGAAPTDREQVVDLESRAPVTAWVPAIPVSEAHATHDLGRAAHCGLGPARGAHPHDR